MSSLFVYSCWSFLGMIGMEQKISIGSGCEYKGIVLHEILHALGRIHEENREDRDSYVVINTENIIQGSNYILEILMLYICLNYSGYENIFDKMEADTEDLSYDYDSIMHYGASAFSSNGKPTITPIQNTDLLILTIGQRNGLSSLDWEHIERAYCSSP